MEGHRKGKQWDRGGDNQGRRQKLRGRKQKEKIDTHH